MKPKKIRRLITQYVNKQATFSERNELERWLDDDSNYELFKEYVKINYLINLNMDMFDLDESKKMFLDYINDEKKIIKKKKFNYYLKYAAVLIVALFASTYLFRENIFDSPKVVKKERVINAVAQITPGTDKAVLTLANGSTINLNIENKFSSIFAKSNGKEIIYNSKKSSFNTVEYNYLTVPRGGQFFIMLSDDTKVWLNSESQLKFPVTFIEGKTRQVELVYGEAFFDVSPSEKHSGAKFIVKNKWQEIEVIGTKFNVKAYKDDSNVYTTLVEGKINIKRGDVGQILIPNQQSNLFTDTNSIAIYKVDVKPEIAWKKGMFYFEDKSLKEIMQVISRWYDVEVVFENKDLESVRFIGVLDKQQSIEEILKIMKSTSINSYKINNKTIILK